MDFHKILNFVVKKTGNTWHQMLRNTIVGLTTLGLDLLILYFLVDYCTIHKVVASVLASIIGGIISFTLSSIWVFNQRRFHNVPLEIVIFTIVGALGLGINTLVFWVMTDLIGLYYILSKIVACVVAFISNFYLRKYTLFSTRKFKKTHAQSEQEP